MSPITASMGLALKRAHVKDAEIVGSGADPQKLAQASKIGAVDKTISGVRSAVDGAQLVILDTTLAHTRDIMEAVGNLLPEGCVVTDTGKVKKQVIDWAEKYLPPRVSFVGGRPVPKTSIDNIEDASATLFENTDYCIVSTESARPGAVRTVVGIVEAMGARPLFLNAHEHDSYAAAMAQLPVILSSALVTSTSSSASWKEMYRLATTEFWHLTHLASNDPEDSQMISMAYSDVLVHWLDRIIEELYQYRNDLKDGGDKLLESFILGWENRARLEADALSDDERPGIPGAGDAMANMFLGARLVERYRQFTGKSRKSWEYYKQS
jgi:prephenate dehydrogenase